MFDEMEKQIDAVVVATPDHTHAVACLGAIERGKHVYCEKPLAHSIFEVRQLRKAATEHKVITQLGNQGHSFDSIRTLCEWIWDGAIGKVQEVHAACDAFPDVYCQIGNLAAAAGSSRSAVHTGLGFVARAHCAAGLPSDVRALQLARLDAFRNGRSGGLGLPRHRSGVLGSGPGGSLQRASGSRGIRSGDAGRRLSRGRGDHLRVRGQGRAGPGEAGLV